ncbi:MAG: bifunctional folylpolyglutamate synthase/dihydrofolate synthase [Prevotella sp.]
MNYKETLEYLYNSTPVFEHVGASAYKEGLQNTLALDEHFGHPHLKFRTIHIAGTNGKGSCSHTIASILQEAGYKVGLYTSPHLVDFRERIKVNNVCISEKEVVEFVESERDFFEPLHPSFFELTTAMAFQYFEKEHVDIAIIEVGLGGRLDCTNIITPILSIITNISFDHTQFLGDTLEKIAAEKAGIMKRGIPVVIGEYNDETKSVFEVRAKELDAPITFAQDSNRIMSSEAIENGGRKYTTADGNSFVGELGGDYQEKNTRTVLGACRILRDMGIINDEKHIYEGIKKVCSNTGLLGRWQKISEKPLTVCDTGHNVAGWEYLSEQIKRQRCKTRRIIFGMVDDKDINSVMNLLPKDAEYYFTQAACKRALSSLTVASIAESHGITGKSYNNVGEAYLQARKEADKNDFIFIGGSSYIVADLLAFIAFNSF